MFEKNSRYYSQEPRLMRDRRGREVSIVPAPPALPETLRGYHLLRQGERLDHLALKYLNDPTAYWRICELNDAMLPQALHEKQEIAIPNPLLQRLA